jgi:hypothetical protein
VFAFGWDGLMVKDLCGEKDHEGNTEPKLELETDRLSVQTQTYNLKYDKYLNHESYSAWEESDESTTGDFSEVASKNAKVIMNYKGETFDRGFWKSFGWFLAVAFLICCLPWMLSKHSIIDLDLDDDNLEMMSYDTWIPEYAVTDNAILDYILEEMTLDGDFLEPENVDVLVILNSIVSFHRSRRL